MCKNDTYSISKIQVNFKIFLTFSNRELFPNFLEVLFSLVLIIFVFLCYVGKKLAAGGDLG